MTDGAAGVGPYAANIIFTGGGGGFVPVPPPSGGGSGSGGGPTTVTPPELPTPPPAPPQSTGPVSTSFVRAPAGPVSVDGGAGDEGFAQPALALASAPTGAGLVNVVAAEALSPSLRVEAGIIDTTALRTELEVEPIRAEMQVLPTRHGLDLAQDGPEQQQIEIVMNSVRLGGMALSVGAIGWAARAAGLVESLLASTPAWRHVDPLPVLGRDDEEEEEQWDGASAEDQEKRDEEHRAAWVLEGRRSEA